MIEIPLPSGEVALVDDDRQDLADQKWYLHKGYVIRRLWENGKSGRRIYLHHEVLGTQPSRTVRVDHKDINPLNNTRENLRLTTFSENAQNRLPVTRRGTYRGVSWRPLKGKWYARATLDYVTYHIGYFDTEEEAAEAVSRWRAEHMTHSDADRLVDA